MVAGSENPGACLKQSPDSSTIDDAVESEFSRRRGCCFYTPIHFFTSTTTSNSTSTTASTSPGGRSGGRCWQRISGTGGRNDGEFMVVRAWKKMREWSEIVAGPKWKNFIRRMGRSVNRPIGCRIGSGNQQQVGKFGYDPLSYAMNFDEGRNSPSDEVDIGFRNFSSRYASFPSSAKSSMDLGKDAPSFL